MPYKSKLSQRVLLVAEWPQAADETAEEVDSLVDAAQEARDVIEAFMSNKRVDFDAVLAKLGTALDGARGIRGLPCARP